VTHNQQINNTMKNFLCVCLVVAASLTALAAGESDDHKTLLGLWIPVKAELSGQPMSDAVLKTISLKLTKDEYHVLVAGEPDNGTWTIDSAAKPKGMTITGTEGPNHGKTFPAIYELTGDTLRICYDLSGAKRLTEFKTIAGTKLYLVTYNRKKE
jgi:uncharacterized protein (TIGR03067 family)